MARCPPSRPPSRLDPETAIDLRFAPFVAACVAVLAAGCGGGSGDTVLGQTQATAPETIKLAATRTTDSPPRAVLAWNAVGSNLSYLVQRGDTAVADIRDTGWTDATIASGTRYCYQVFGRNGFGWQARSNEVCIGEETADTGWTITRLAAGRWPALAIDAKGDVHVCFAGTNGTGISYLKAGSNASAEIVEADGQAQCAIAVDGDGLVHVAYLTRFGLRHATRGASGWSAATVDPEALAGAQRFDGPALALAVDGTPRIAYRRALGGSTTIAVSTRAGTSWTRELPAIAGYVGPRSLAIDRNGFSRLATTDELGQSATAWRNTGTQWQAEYRQSLAPTGGDGPPIALNPAETTSARIAWWQRDAPTANGAVRLSWSESQTAGWVTQTIAAGTGLGTRVAIAMVGSTPYVAALDVGGAVRLYTRADSAWTLESLDAQGGRAEALDFGIGGDGRLRIVYDRPDEPGVILASRRR